MRLATLAANIGMSLSVAQAGQIVACTAYDVEKADQASKSEQSIAKKAHDTFESQFAPAAMQKVAQIIGEGFLGPKIGSAAAAYSSSLIYMLFHKSMLAGTNYEFSHDKNSYVPESLPSFYQNKISPLVNFIKEKVYGIYEHEIKWNRWLGTSAITVASLFLDKEVGYPGTRDIRKAHGLARKVTEAIKSKFAYMGSYFLYQGIIAWSYSEKLNTTDPIVHLKVLGEKIRLAFKRKHLSTLAVAMADSLAEMLNSSQAKKLIPSPLIAGVLRIVLMSTAVKAQSAKQRSVSPKLTPDSNPEHPSSMHKVSLLEESLQT
ncbi:MAG: hypothetical protein VKK32_09065 [Candidatus Melainabacteria bacterium]|nr:hypothetical protein [Candidatus Melainabacteria bacterium]